MHGQLMHLQAKAEAARKGDIVPGDAFDSNCITPGTPFMARLGAHFRFFVRKKISEDPAWQRPQIIFSGGLQSFECWILTKLASDAHALATLACTFSCSVCPATDMPWIAVQADASHLDFRRISTLLPALSIIWSTKGCSVAQALHIAHSIYDI